MIRSLFILAFMFVPLAAGDSGLGSDMDGAAGNRITIKETNGILDTDAKTPFDFSPSGADDQLDYSKCAGFYENAVVRTGDVVAIRLKGDHYVGYSKTRPKHPKVAKYDPFTGLFLLRDVSAKYSYTLVDIDDHALNNDIIATNSRSTEVGRLKRVQGGFLDYAAFSKSIPEHGVVGNICYQMYGLGVGKNMFIQKLYLDRFVERRDTVYGDIGVRFITRDKATATFEVVYSDPFFPDNPFKRGDILVSINGVAPRDMKSLELLVADLPIGGVALVKMRRDDKVVDFEVRVGTLHGGYLLSDSFLERFGIILDNDFVVKKTRRIGMMSSLEVGDRILSFGGISMDRYSPKTSWQRNKILRDLFTILQDKVLEIRKNKLEQIAQEQYRLSKAEEGYKLLDGNSMGSNINGVFVVKEDIDDFMGVRSSSSSKDLSLSFEGKELKALGETIIRDKSDVLLEELKNPTHVKMIVDRKGVKVELPLFR